MTDRLVGTGIYRTPSGGWLVYARIHGRLYKTRQVCPDLRTRPGYPASLEYKEVKAWRDAWRTTLRADPAGEPGTFARDVEDYLAAVASMPSIADRQLHMRAWAAAPITIDGRVRTFGDCARQTIPALAIRAQLAQWRTTLTAASCNRRRTALMSFYTKMNGKSGDNPVRDIERYAEEEAPRALTFSLAYRILACMRPSQTRARLRVMIWTGWPHAQVMRLRPEHVDLAHARAFVTPRRKGKGRKGSWLPLLPGAVIALKAYREWDCYGTPDQKNPTRPPGYFSTSSMRTSFRRAVAKLNAHRARLGQPPLPADTHPYDLRHTFGTEIAERITDDRAIQELMMHSTAEQTRRYTERATTRRVREAVERLAGNLAGNLFSHSRRIRTTQDHSGTKVY